MGNTCKPMAVSFQCMTKFTTNKKNIYSQKKRLAIKLLKEIFFKKSDIYWDYNLYKIFILSMCVCVCVCSFWVWHMHTAINHCFTKLSNIPIIVKIFHMVHWCQSFPSALFSVNLWFDFCTYSFACSRMWYTLSHSYVAFWLCLLVVVYLRFSHVVEYICGLFLGIVLVVFL